LDSDARSHRGQATSWGEGARAENRRRRMRPDRDKMMASAVGVPRPPRSHAVPMCKSRWRHCRCARTRKGRGRSFVKCARLGIIRGWVLETVYLVFDESSMRHRRPARRRLSETGVSPIPSSRTVGELMRSLISFRPKRLSDFLRGELGTEGRPDGASLAEARQRGTAIAHAAFVEDQVQAHHYPSQIDSQTHAPSEPSSSALPCARAGCGTPSNERNK
jgi:hypothetical protein